MPAPVTQPAPRPVAEPAPKTVPEPEAAAPPPPAPAVRTAAIMPPPRKPAPPPEPAPAPTPVTVTPTAPVAPAPEPVPVTSVVPAPAPAPPPAPNVTLPLAPVQPGAQATEYAVAYYNRGWAYAGRNLLEQAVDDYTQAIRLNRNYADAFFARGWVQEQRNRFEPALKDYTRAIELQPRHALAYNNRGVLRLRLDDHRSAAKDFVTAFTLADANLRSYTLLWLYLSRARAGDDGRAELAGYAKKLDLGRWPGVVVSLFLGEAATADVVAGTRDGNPEKRRAKEVVAYYYLGQHRLLAGDDEAARDYFQKAVATGVTSYVQYGAARDELKRLGAL
jgi:lipoprotein NlpI